MMTVTLGRGKVIMEKWRCTGCEPGKRNVYKNENVKAHFLMMDFVPFTLAKRYTEQNIVQKRNYSPFKRSCQRPYI